jgi:ABC-type dipeptide/oligopeptide/nickel transport system ATPase component
MGTGSFPVVNSLLAKSSSEKEAPIYRAKIIGEAKVKRKKTKERFSKVYTVHLVAAVNKAAQPSKTTGKVKRTVYSKTDHKEGDEIYCTLTKGLWEECDNPSKES